ncbi:MAG: phage major capsid protein [Shewanella algae]
MTKTNEDIEKQYNSVKADLKDVSDQLKAFADQSAKDVKNHVAMSQETKESVDKLLVTQGELQARLSTAEQMLANGIESHKGGIPKTMGHKVINSDGFEENLARLSSNKGSFSVPVQAAITSDAASAGDAIDGDRVPGIVPQGERRLTIRDLLNWGTTTSNSVEFVQETGFTNNADVVSENPSSGKPESTIILDLKSAPVATIAHFIHASRQVLSDAGMLQAHIDGRLRYGLKLKEETQLLKGSGAGLNINGIYTQATAYSDPGVTVSNETNIDRLRIAMLQVELAEYMADGIVLHPIDWATIELTKDSQNRYIFANPQGLAGPSMWGKPVVATQSMDQGEYLTGAFRMGAQGWDREQSSVMLSTEDRDNFIKNMVTILCEERVALTVYRPESFVKGTMPVTSE